MGKYLQADNKCLTTCPNGYFKNEANRVCEICSTNCLTCVSTNTTCTSCETTTPKFLFQSGCYEQCPNEGYFADTVSGSCLPCDSSCLSCKASATDCIACVAPYFYDQAARSCVAACGAEQYINNDICYDCQEFCQTCFSGLHSDCSYCKAGSFLQQDGNTCLPSCPEGQAGDSTTRECIACTDYCDKCTSRTYCTDCAGGYTTVGDGTCLGQHDHKAIPNKPINLRFSNLSAEPFTEYSVELWVKTSDPTSGANEVILGMSPMKIRKKSVTGKIQLFYGTTFTVSYCDTVTSLLTDKWHHFAFTLNSETGTLKCYFDGENVPVGSNPLSIVVTTLEKPTELVYGYTTVPGTESPF